MSKKQLDKKQTILSKNNVLSLSLIKIEIPAGGAVVTPPLGPLLGQYGLNTLEFCKEFNEDTKIIEKDTMIPTNIYYGVDKSFFFELKKPTVSYLIKKFIESAELERVIIDTKSVYVFERKLFLKMIYNIMLFRYIFDLNSPVGNSLSGIELTLTPLKLQFLKNQMHSIIGTAKSFNIIIENK